MSVAPIDYTAGLEVAVEIKTDLGEGPIWDSGTATLVFVDSNAGGIYRFDPTRNHLSRTDVGTTIGVAIPRLAGGFVASSIDGLLEVTENSGRARLLLPIEQDRPLNRMNDGKCDSHGRLWSGTLSVRFERGAGSLYRIDPNLSLVRAVEGVRVSNGIAWSPDETLLYFNDTLSRGVDVFDYDTGSGSLSNRRRFVEIEREIGLPDGMAVDTEGCVWVALFHGGQVRRYSPDGAWIGVVSLPVARVTSCNFGGPDLEDLYITTADLKICDDGKPHEREAGFVFRCRPGMKGLPSHKFAG